MVRVFWVFFQSSAQLNKASWITSIPSLLPQGEKGRKGNICLQFGLDLPPLSRFYPCRAVKCIGTSKRIPEVKDKRMDPGVVQVKIISHSYIFNKIYLFLLLPRKLVLRCTQIITYCGTVNYYRCHRIQAALSPGRIFKCSADVYGLLQNFCQVTHTTQHLLNNLGTR